MVADLAALADDPTAGALPPVEELARRRDATAACVGRLHWAPATCTVLLLRRLAESRLARPAEFAAELGAAWAWLTEWLGLPPAAAAAVLGGPGWLLRAGRAAALSRSVPAGRCAVPGLLAAGRLVRWLPAGEELAGTLGLAAGVAGRAGQQM